MSTENYPEFSFPPFFEIETIRACNSRCVFCPFGTGQLHESGLMPDWIYNKVVAEILEHASEIRRISLCIFGETLLDKKMERRVDELKRGGIAEVAINTNASLLFEDRAIGLLEAGLDIMRMSVSTVNPEKYRQIRIGLDFDAVIANVKRFFRLRDEINPRTRVYVSMERHKIVSDDDVRAWREHWNRFTKPGDMLKVTEVFDLVEEDRGDLGGDRKRKPCEALKQTMEIIYTGEAIICCADFKGSASPYVLGDVKNESLETIWNGQKAKRYRELHRSGRRDEIEICRGCDMWDLDIVDNVKF